MRTIYEKGTNKKWSCFGIKKANTQTLYLNESKVANKNYSSAYRKIGSRGHLKVNLQENTGNKSYLLLLTPPVRMDQKASPSLL